MGKLRTYAVDGAKHLKTLGFEERFCKICEGVNRYSQIKQREPESDILELVDQFGGMLIDRPERVGFAPDEALVLIEHRNLKSEYNRFLESFRDFVEQMEKIEIHGSVNTTAFARLQKLIRDSKTVPEFVKKISIEYSENIDSKLEELIKESEMKNSKNVPMFSSEVERKILNNVKVSKE